MDVIVFLTVALIFLINFYIAWKHPRRLRTFNFLLNISGAIFFFIISVLIFNIPKGLIIGAIVAPLWLFIIYSSLFIRRKMAGAMLGSPAGRVQDKSDDLVRWSVLWQMLGA